MRSTTLKGIWIFFGTNRALIDRILTVPTAADRCTVIRDNEEIYCIHSLPLTYHHCNHVDYIILKPGY